MKSLSASALTACFCLLASAPLPAQSDAVIQETSSFIRGKLLSLNATGASRSYRDVELLGNGCAMRLSLADNSEMLISFGQLDPTAVVWEVYDPAAHGSPGAEKLMLLDVVARQNSALSHRTFHPIHDTTQPTYPFVFSLAKAADADTQGFRDRTLAAVKYLIKACASAPPPVEAIHKQPAFDPATGPDLTGTWVVYDGNTVSQTWRVTRDSPGRYTFDQINTSEGGGFGIHWDGAGHFVMGNPKPGARFIAAYQAACGAEPPRDTTLGRLSPDGSTLTLTTTGVSGSINPVTCGVSQLSTEVYVRH